jgi:anti-sigma factor RsiW
MTGHISEENIALLAGGDLDPRENANLQQHIIQCPACSAMLRTYREGRDALSALREEELSAIDYGTVRTAVLDRLPGRATRSFWRWPSLLWAASATAILLALGLGFIWMRSGSPSRVAEIPGPQKAPTIGRIASSKAEAPKPAPAIRAVRATSNAGPKRASNPARKINRAASSLVAGAEKNLQPPANQAPVLDDIAIKLETEDPNVIIIWLVSPRGEWR